MGTIRAAAPVTRVPRALLRHAHVPGVRARPPGLRRQFRVGEHRAHGQRLELSKLCHDHARARPARPSDPVLPGDLDGAGRQREAQGTDAVVVRVRAAARDQRARCRHRVGEHLHPVRLAQYDPRGSGDHRSPDHLAECRDAVADHPDDRHRRGLAGDLDHHDHPRGGSAIDPARVLRGSRRLRRLDLAEAAAGDPAHAPAEPTGRADPADDPRVSGLRHRRRAWWHGRDRAVRGGSPVGQ